MSESRLSPSDIVAFEAVLGLSKGTLADRWLSACCDEIRACWADIAAATEAMQKQSDEMALLRAIAIAVAEEEAQSPATESAAFAALRDWQKWKREG